MYIQEYALLKCKCVNSKMHVQNTVNQTVLLYVVEAITGMNPIAAAIKLAYGYSL